VSGVVIRAKDLRKVYRLYAKPSFRFRDMFGLLGDKPGAYTEHAALDGINLEIRRGEKVAIIGRNGAGKSTFLKLVTRVIDPTSGELEVHADVHALLQIGTGFHPDFTGRENVYAYLAQLGVTGAEAERRCADVIEFAEIEEYIDQPVKTYSTGMAVRLMFSASTAITPDLLVLDEVLGVGDAYFAHKSYARMKELCESSGSTLLLVTHDVYSAINLCERVIWIDRGQVVIDGDGPTVVKAYEDSVRRQEESRLRTRKQQKLAEAHHGASPEHSVRGLMLEIHARGNRPQPCPVYFSSIELLSGDAVVASLPLDAEPRDEGGSRLQREAACWGDATTWEGRRARPFLNYGSSFHKVAGAFVVPQQIVERGEDALSLRIDYWSAQPCDLVAQMFVEGRGVALGSLPPASRTWTRHVVGLADGEAQRASSFTPDGVQGTGAIVVDDVRMIGPAGDESYIAEHGAPIRFVFDYHIHDPTLRERAQFAVIFHRDGVQTVCRVVTRDLLFDASSAPSGRVILRLPKLVLSPGEYMMSVFVAREGYFDEQQTVFYSLNPGVYYCLNRVLQISVVGGGLIAGGAVFVGEGEWSLETESSVALLTARYNHA
jgi:lipopolysaccharide transport system ATP-binding protein